MRAARPAFSLRGSIAAHLAVGVGLLLAVAVAAVSLVFYLGTVGVFERSIDNQVSAIAARMVQAWNDQGAQALKHEIDVQLNDSIDSDIEIVGLLDDRGRVLAGNLPVWRGALPVPGELAFATIERDGAPVSARLLAQHLDDGTVLVVGRDLRELDAIRTVIERALAASAVVSVLLAFLGALLFRRSLEARIGRIRRTAARIAAGDLSSRIDVQGDDEFARLGADINRMLDRIESLMEGVRHVSNSIAHDLRTPLGRVRNRLDRALQAAADRDSLVADARLAIEDIDGLISLFDKLLQIAAAEAGMRTRSFEALDLGEIARDMTELYEAAAEEQGVALRFLGDEAVPVRGDRHLLANALASLIDNAIKYARAGLYVDVEVRHRGRDAVVTVRDYGPGVPEGDLDRVTERFYRVDQSRHLPGNGLGLSIVMAIAQLHGAAFELRNAGPGLEVSITFAG
ncbi:HAMP domain-containing sensor histidine kinase [uncultured Massilia sp.]|uniref:sensor histidine kinase n=1 Tax=uncultured Massilia sp. TaxID=169973 RepID=UPI0025CD3023|nr:HAMP domain-containing sensor histidine kinase [uncultured Massilia sp.]